MQQFQHTTTETFRGRFRTSLPVLVLLTPACLLFSTLVIYPIFASVRLSLYNWDGIGPLSWVGLANYRELLSDVTFHTAIRNNLCWLVLNMLAPMLGLALAMFLNQAVMGIRLVRALFFLPFVISPVVVGLVFSWFFNSRLGILNEVLGWFALGPVAMLDSENWAIFAVILAGLWPQTAYCAILYVTGLTIIRPELIEVARLDGAGGWRLLWHVVLPQLRPITFIAVMVSIVSALRGFDLVMIMTLGGPYNSSTVLAYHMYEQTFLSHRYGYGAAIATVLFTLMSVCVGVVLWRLLRRERA